MRPRALRQRRRPAGEAPAPGFTRLRDPMPLYAHLAEVVREKVASGELGPGERLPRETELAASLGVSRPSVREALKILSALGVVSIRHGAGVYVTAASADDIAHRLAPSPAIPPEELRHVFEVRRALECQAAAWAAQMATAEDLTALQLVVTEMTKVVEGAIAGTGADSVTEVRVVSRNPLPLDRLEQLDAGFHRRLTVATHNAVLVRLMDSMIDLIRESRRYSLSIPGRAIQSVYDHRRIFEAVVAGRPVGAARAMYRHIAGVEEDIFRRRRTPMADPQPGAFERGNDSERGPTGCADDQRAALVMINRRSPRTHR